VAELLRRGVAKVYAAARRPETVDVPGAVPPGPVGGAAVAVGGVPGGDEVDLPGPVADTVPVQWLSAGERVRTAENHP
jgi:hypothetical protein